MLGGMVSVRSPGIGTSSTYASNLPAIRNISMSSNGMGEDLRNEVC